MLVVFKLQYLNHNKVIFGASVGFLFLSAIVDLIDMDY